MNLRRLYQTKWIIGIAFILLGIGIMLASSLPKSFSYYVTVAELMKERRHFQDQDLKVAGTVLPGSIQQGEDPLAWSFEVTHAEDVLPVVYRGAVPDMFKGGAEVVVTGRLNGKGQLVASELLAKCASRYEAKLKPGHIEMPPEK